jgi:hypothetical protein
MNNELKRTDHELVVGQFQVACRHFARLRIPRKISVRNCKPSFAPSEQEYLPLGGELRFTYPDLNTVCSEMYKEKR